MNRNAALAFALLVGCAEETSRESGPVATHSCPPGTSQILAAEGSFAWCRGPDGSPTGPWMTYHAPQKPASTGEFRDGQLLGPYRSWWSSGVRAAEIDTTTGPGHLVLYDAYGKQAGRIPTVDGVLEACPGRAVPTAPITDRVWRVECTTRSLTDQEQVGVQYTAGADGQLESAVFMHDGAPHGPMFAWHPDGRIWMYGEFFGGKRHGPWFVWNREGRRIHTETGVTLDDGAAAFPPLSPRIATVTAESAPEPGLRTETPRNP